MTIFYVTHQLKQIFFKTVPISVKEYRVISPDKSIITLVSIILGTPVYNIQKNYYYRQEFRYSWLSSATRAFTSTEMKMKTIGE